MGLKPLTRKQEDYVWAMKQWMTCPDLNPQERALVGNLLSAAERSLDDFAAMRVVASTGFFRPTLLSAIEKGRRAGLLREWSK
mgnify:CR=1 FL=1